MSSSAQQLESIMSTSVFMRGESRRFGELTADDVRGRAAELRAAVGWGPTVRVAPIATAWRDLGMRMERCGAASVQELGEEDLIELGGKLWLVL
jgi:hypothetical protein